MTMETVMVMTKMMLSVVMLVTTIAGVLQPCTWKLPHRRQLASYCRPTPWYVSAVTPCSSIMTMVMIMAKTVTMSVVVRIVTTSARLIQPHSWVYPHHRPSASLCRPICC